MFKLQGRKSACRTSAGSSESVRWLTPFFGFKYGPQNGVQNWITFSFLLLSLCFGPVLGSRCGSKSGSAIGEVCCPQRFCSRLRRTSVSINSTYFFSVHPTLLLPSGRNISTDFFRSCFGGMMKQVCWHSRRSEAYRGLPDARMAGATVEETAFENVNMWQAPVSQKPPLWALDWQGQVWEARPDGEYAWFGQVWKEA